MNNSSLVKALIVLLIMANTASAACSFLSIQADNIDIERPATAIFTISVSNLAENAEIARINTLCNPSQLDCAFTDLADPLQLAGLETKTVHLSIASAGLANGTYSIPLQVWGGITGACLDERNLALTVTGTEPNNTINGTPTASITPTGDVIARPGDVIDYIIILSNNAPETRIFNVRSGNSEGNHFSTTLSGSEEVLEAGGSALMQARVTIPIGTPTNVFEFTFLVTVTDAAGNRVTLDLPARIFVYSQSLNLQVTTASAQCLNAFHYKDAYDEVTLKNYGEITGTFTTEITSSSAIAPYLRADKRVFELKQDESTTLRINTIIPPNVAPGTYAYTLNVRYGNYIAATRTSCINVYSVTGIDALSTQEFTVTRGSLTRIPLPITNNGSIENTYSFSYSPTVAKDYFLIIDPSSLTISPGATREATIIIQTGPLVQLGKLTVPITIHSAAGAKVVELKTTVASANGTDSILRILAPETTIFAGIPSQKTFRVFNYGSTSLDNVHFWLDGLPQAYWSSITPRKTIAPGKSADYLVTFNVPLDYADSLVPYSAIAAAGLESTKQRLSLNVLLPNSRLDFNIVETTAQPGTGGVRLKLSVTNTGNMPATRVTPRIPSTGEYAVESDTTPDLAPGASEYVYVRITPLSDVPAQDVFLRLQSNEGATAQKTVRLPATGAATNALLNADDAWKLIAIIVILAGILALLSREEVADMLSKR